MFDSRTLMQLRLLSRPFAIFLIGVICSFLIGSVDTSVSPFLVAIPRYLGLIPLAIMLWGICWLALNVWRLWRLEQGALNGDCFNCGGILEDRNGRYGPYRKCMMCGSTKKGHY